MGRVPVTGVDLEIFGVITQTSQSNGSSVRLRPADTLILPPHTIPTSNVADTFPPSGWYCIAHVSQHRLSFLFITRCRRCPITWHISTSRCQNDKWMAYLLTARCKRCLIATRCAEKKKTKESVRNDETGLHRRFRLKWVFVPPRTIEEWTYLLTFTYFVAVG